jgi:SpoVK/Ycf46/Vps4 family AAA+-type ATPase
MSDTTPESAPDPNPDSNPDPSAGRRPAPTIDGTALRLLEKALRADPGDWETRGFLLRHSIATGDWTRARELLSGATRPPESEDDLLAKARVEAEDDPEAAVRTLSSLLQRNKACARAYLQWAQILRRQGRRDEASRKYGAATLLDETLADPNWEAWLHDTPAQADPAASPVASPQTTPPPTPRAQASAPPVLHRPGDQPDMPTAEEIARAVQDATGPVLPPLTFADIGGMTEVIERIRLQIIHPFRNPEVFRKFRRGAGGGILLYGPPGCGKTHIARATAGECRATFLSIAVTDVLSKWVGESERHLHDLFETARRRSPTVVFIDEIDAIGMSRHDAGASGASLVNVLLTELDGIASANDNLLVLAATNSPWRVDNALRRPGRFDRVLFVPPPDTAAREAILGIHLRGLPQEPLDLGKLARKTERFSGADLRAVVTRAAEQAILTEMQTGRESRLTQRMLTETIATMRPSTTEWLETARNYASYANRSGFYDELAAYLA